jgi:hypothetical protein
VGWKARLTDQAPRPKTTNSLGGLPEGSEV